MRRRPLRGFASSSGNPLHVHRQIVRVYTRVGPLEPRRFRLAELVDAIHLPGPDDFVGRRTPQETAGPVEMLRFCEEAFTLLQCGLRLRALDRDTRDMRKLLDQVLIAGRGRFGLAVVDRKRAQRFLGSRQNRRRPTGTQAVRQCQRAPFVCLPSRVRHDVGRDHLLAQGRCHRAWS